MANSLFEIRNVHSSFNEQTYIEKWDELEDKMIQEGFHWAALFENEEWNQYMSYSLLEMKPELWRMIQQSTEDIGLVFQKTYEIIMKHPILLEKLQLPIALLPLVQMESAYFSYFARMDFILSNDNTVKICEINCDTPVGFLEPSVGNRFITEEYGIHSPNEMEKNVRQTWEILIQHYQIQTNETIYFTSYQWHSEDTSTVEFIQQHCPHSNTKYVDVEQLVVTEEGVFSPCGERISFLYRLYPLEYLLNEPQGEQFIQHVQKGTIHLINPPSAFLMQTKEMMALIWELAENDSSFYTNEEKRIIQTHFIPTYWDETTFKKHGTPYVSKPVLGREGGGVSIVENDQIEEDTTAYYYQQKKIYQQYVNMPSVTIETWDGPYTGRLLIGSHLLNGQASGLFLRVGERITGNLSMFIGVSKGK